MESQWLAMIFASVAAVALVAVAGAARPPALNASDVVKIEALRDTAGLFFDHTHRVQFAMKAYHFVVEVDHRQLYARVQRVHDAAVKMVAEIDAMDAANNLTACGNRHTIRQNLDIHVVQKCNSLRDYHHSIEYDVKVIDERDSVESGERAALPELTTAAPVFRSRVRRGVADFIGRWDKYLFGLMDADDAAELHQIAKGQNSINQQVRNLTSDMIAVVHNLERRLDCVAAVKDADVCHYMEQKLFAFREELFAVERVYDKLNDAVYRAKHNSLHVSVVTPQKLMAAMQNVTLPAHLSWPVNVAAGNDAHELVDDVINTHVFITQRRRFLFIIEIPLIKKLEFDLFQIVTLPMCKGASCVFILPRSKYLGISPDRHTYVRMNEVSTCKPVGDTLLCYKPGTRYVTSGSTECDVRIFMRDTGDLAFERDCDVRVAKFSDEIFHPISTYNRWMYLVREPTELNFVCDQYVPPVTLAPGVGVMSGSGTVACEISTKRGTITVHELKSDARNYVHINATTDFDLSAAVRDTDDIKLGGRDGDATSADLDHDSLRNIALRLTDLRTRMRNNTVYGGAQVTDDPDMFGDWIKSFDFGFWKDIKIVFYALVVFVVLGVFYKVYTVCFKSDAATTVRNHYIDREMVYLNGSGNNNNSNSKTTSKL